MSEFAYFVRNFIKEIRKGIWADKSIKTRPTGSGKNVNGLFWMIRKEDAGNHRFKTNNPNIDGMDIKITFGSNRMNIFRTNTHIGWNDYHFLLYADPICTPETVIRFITEIPDPFIKAWLECKEKADDFNVEIR